MKVVKEGKVYEIPDTLVDQLLGSGSQVVGSTQAGQYPIATRSEFSIQPDDTITPEEIQNDLGKGTEVLDFNDSRNTVKPNTWHCYQ